MTLLVTDADPVFTGEIAVGKRLLNAIFRLLGRLLQFHETQLLHHGFRFCSGCFLAFLGMDCLCLEHLCHQLHFGARCHREHIAVKVDRIPLVPGFGNHFFYDLQHTQALVANIKSGSIQTAGAAGRQGQRGPDYGPRWARQRPGKEHGHH